YCVRSVCLRISPSPCSPPLSLHDALPISLAAGAAAAGSGAGERAAHVRADPLQLCGGTPPHLAEAGVIGRGRHLLVHLDVALERSEEHTSELQSRFDLVCRLLLVKQKNDN